MSLFAGVLRTEDLSVALSTFQPEVIEEQMGILLAQYQQERAEAQSLLVGSTITRAQARVEQGAIDEGQEIGPDGRPLETYHSGYYEVGYPLKRVAWALGWNRETFARMTVADLDKQFNAKVAGNARRHSREILKALLFKANYDYTDELEGTVTVTRLANTDGTIYLPDNAEENHYLTSGYAANALSATNNPFVTIANEIREHYTTSTRVVVFINSAQVAEIQADLPSFVDGPVAGIAPSTLTATALDPGVNVPGDFLGTDSASGAYVYVWNRIPANYMYGQAVDETPPLVQRIPAEAMLQGFTSLDEEAHLPFYKRSWIEIFGYSVAQRLVGVAMELTADATYDNPTTL